MVSVEVFKVAYDGRKRTCKDVIKIELPEDVVAYMYKSVSELANAIGPYLFDLSDVDTTSEQNLYEGGPTLQKGGGYLLEIAPKDEKVRKQQSFSYRIGVTSTKEPIRVYEITTIEECINENGNRYGEHVKMKMHDYGKFIATTLPSIELFQARFECIDNETSLRGIINGSHLEYISTVDGAFEVTPDLVRTSLDGCTYLPVTFCWTRHVAVPVCVCDGKVHLCKQAIVKNRYTGKLWNPCSTEFDTHKTSTKLCGLGTVHEYFKNKSYDTFSTLQQVTFNIAFPFESLCTDCTNQVE
jgi:hypothetical protein